jgi:hypothetical protein
VNEEGGKTQREIQTGEKPAAVTEEEDSEGKLRQCKRPRRRGRGKTQRERGERARRR